LYRAIKGLQSRERIGEGFRRVYRAIGTRKGVRRGSAEGRRRGDSASCAWHRKSWRERGARSRHIKDIFGRFVRVFADAEKGSYRAVKGP